jgi:hypothetical protein
MCILLRGYVPLGCLFEVLFCDIEGQFGDIEGQFDRIQWIAEHVEGYFILNLHFITRVYAYMLAVGGPSSLQHHSKSPRTTKLDLPDHQLQVILPYILLPPTMLVNG